MIKFRVKDEPVVVDDVKLIKLVKKHELLYNTKSPDYRNLPVRNVIWGNIAVELGIDDQNIVQKRWKVIREKFSVAFRKFQFDGIVSSWRHYQMCTFLEPNVNLKLDHKQDVGDDAPLFIQNKLLKSPFDESSLTKLVKERPILYDKRHEDFRAGDLRRTAWLEVAQISGWDVRTLQKRWRVMRDRFVRELRRTKNVDENNIVTCSAFFRDMLFLARHVKSKKYEAEASDLTSDTSQDNWSFQASTEDESKFQSETLETCIISDAAVTEGVVEGIDASSEGVTYAIDETQNYDECFEPHEANEANEQENFDDCASNGYYEEEEEDEAIEHLDDQQQFISDGEDVVAVQEISEDQWFEARRYSENSGSSKKRRISFDEHHKEISPQPKPVSPVPSSSNRMPYREPAQALPMTDEDTAFGQMVGLMLQKFPPHLKTSVKLKVLQGIAEFEALHKIN